eukprot:1153481-Pelagomonas_calceolata.AAC.3
MGLGKGMWGRAELAKGSSFAECRQAVGDGVAAPPKEADLIPASVAVQNRLRGTLSSLAIAPNAHACLCSLWSGENSQHALCHCAISTDLPVPAALQAQMHEQNEECAPGPHPEVQACLFHFSPSVHTQCNVTLPSLYTPRQANRRGPLGNTGQARSSKWRKSNKPHGRPGKSNWGDHAWDVQFTGNRLALIITDVLKCVELGGATATAAVCLLRQQHHVLAGGRNVGACQGHGLQGHAGSVVAEEHVHHRPTLHSLRELQGQDEGAAAVVHAHGLGLHEGQVGGDVKAVHMDLHALLRDGALAVGRWRARGAAEGGQHGHLRALLRGCIDLHAGCQWYAQEGGSARKA